MINFATLTGAIIVALGNFYAGLFSNSDKLSEKLTNSGKKTDEKVWRFPLGKDYDDLLNCDIADMKNTGGRFGGAITAALLLEEFIDDYPWIHLDIAGPARSSDNELVRGKGATGFGVMGLYNFVVKLI